MCAHTCCIRLRIYFEVQAVWYEVHVYFSLLSCRGTYTRKCGEVREVLKSEASEYKYMQTICVHGCSMIRAKYMQQYYLFIYTTTAEYSRDERITLVFCLFRLKRASFMNQPQSVQCKLLQVLARAGLLLQQYFSRGLQILIYTCAHTRPHGIEYSLTHSDGPAPPLPPFPRAWHGIHSYFVHTYEVLLLYILLYLTFVYIWYSYTKYFVIWYCCCTQTSNQQPATRNRLESSQNRNFGFSKPRGALVKYTYCCMI